MIGIYGGTFDPVHYGHLRTALEVKEMLGMDRIHIIPCGEPPHRSKPLASSLQRMQMLKRAIEGVPGFVADDREMQRSGPSYMVDTLKSFHDEGVTSPCLIMGMDAFLGLESWKQWQDILHLCRLVVMHRPDSDPGVIEKSQALNEEVLKRQVDWQAIQQQAAGHLCFLPVTQLAISASEIRQKIREGMDVRFLLPERVREFILVEKLYE